MTPLPHGASRRKSGGQLFPVAWLLFVKMGAGMGTKYFSPFPTKGRLGLGGGGLWRTPNKPEDDKIFKRNFLRSDPVRFKSQSGLPDTFWCPMQLSPPPAQRLKFRSLVTWGMGPPGVGRRARWCPCRGGGFVFFFWLEVPKIFRPQN